MARSFVAGAWPTPAVVPVDGDDARERAALACYVSQLRALEAEWAISAKLDAPAQCWRLAPAPPGWEPLADPAGWGGPPTAQSSAAAWGTFAP